MLLKFLSPEIGKLAKSVADQPSLPMSDFIEKRAPDRHMQGAIQFLGLDDRKILRSYLQYSSGRSSNSLLHFRQKKYFSRQTGYDSDSLSSTSFHKLVSFMFSCRWDFFPLVT